MLLPQALMIGPKRIWICIIFICIRQHLPRCYPSHPLFLGCLSLPQAAWTPAGEHHSAIPGMKGNVSGLLGGAGFVTSVATAKESIPRLTAPFPAQLDIVPAPPPLGGERDSSDGQRLLSVVPVHSVYNVIASPSQQQGLPQLAQLFCSVPVSVPVSMSVSLPVSIPASVPVKSSIAVVSFTPLSPVSKVSPL